MLKRSNFEKIDLQLSALRDSHDSDDFQSTNLLPLYDLHDLSRFCPCLDFLFAFDDLAS